jgi:uncharacterized protein DUF4439
MTKSTTYDDALKAAISGEYAAIYGYGVIGSHLSGRARALAAQTEVAHRNLRDSMLDTLTDPPPAAAEYAMPFPVTNVVTAIAAAVAIEDKCAALWRAAVSAADTADREHPLDEMINAAMRASAFRRLGGATPGTVAFPGQ